MNGEPVATSAAIQAFLVASLGVATVLFDLSNDVVGALSALIVAAVVLGAAVTRSKVTPVGKG